MFTITCDKCEVGFDVDDHLAGHKVECPRCGDVNRVPDAGPEKPADTPASRPADRAQRAGYPPDSGPEQRVVKVRRCWFRSRPLKFSFALVVVLAGASGAVWSLIKDHSSWAVGAWIALAVFALGVIAWWWLDRLTAALEVTNKRTVEHRGLFSRSTSEVVHDNIRNVQVDQSFWQRIWGVGRIGISSSGQDGIEISVNHLRQPDKLREIIDLYREL